MMIMQLSAILTKHRHKFLSSYLPPCHRSNYFAYRARLYCVCYYREEMICADSGG